MPHEWVQDGLTRLRGVLHGEFVNNDGSFPCFGGLCPGALRDQEDVHEGELQG